MRQKMRNCLFTGCRLEKNVAASFTLSKTRFDRVEKRFVDKRMKIFRFNDDKIGPRDENHFLKQNFNSRGQFFHYQTQN